MTLYANIIEAAVIECGQLSLNFKVQFGDDKPEQVQRIVLPIAAMKELGRIFMPTEARVKIRRRRGATPKETER